MALAVPHELDGVAVALALIGVGIGGAEGVHELLVIHAEQHPVDGLELQGIVVVIDQYLKDNGGEVDYIHGDDVTRELGSKPGNMGFLLPAMGKEQLFKTVMADGVLPRKTFSMGHAQDKRYYIEARKIVK